jgi:plasmid stabilization system protein ParE
VKLRFTKRAVRQIEEIIDAIARESPQGARRVRERMQSITTLLIEHPQIGRPAGHCQGAKNLSRHWLLSGLTLGYRYITIVQ